MLWKLTNNLRLTGVRTSRWDKIVAHPPPNHQVETIQQPDYLVTIKLCGAWGHAGIVPADSRLDAKRRSDASVRTVTRALDVGGGRNQRGRAEAVLAIST